MGISKTAYILQIHKNPDQVNKFINQLITENQADVYVHIDKKNYDNLKGGMLVSPNVHVLNECINCEWGDISQVDSTLLLLKAVINSEEQYDFVLLRSGQDLLIKNGLKDFLDENQGKVFINFRVVKGQDFGQIKINWPKMTRKRYTSAHPIRIFRRILINLYSRGINILPNNHKWNQDYTFYKGSQWFAIPFEVAKFIVDFLEKNDWYYNYFKNTLVPDECFFHTLIMNSPFRNHVVNNNLMFLKWGETLSERNSPQDLTMADIKRMEESNQYFARKFDEQIDNNVVNYFAEKVKFGRIEQTLKC